MYVFAVFGATNEPVIVDDGNDGDNNTTKKKYANEQNRRFEYMPAHILDAATHIIYYLNYIT